MKISKTKPWVIASAVLAWAGVTRLVVADTTASWSSAVNGSWTDGTKWSSHPNYPDNGIPTGINYNVSVAAPGTGGTSYSISIGQNITVDALTINSSAAMVQQDAGVMTINGTLDLKAGAYQLQTGTLKNARIQSEGGAFSLSPVTSAPILDGITLATPLTLTAGTPAYLQNGLTLAGTMLTLAGDSSVGSAHLYSSGNMTLGGTGTVVFSGTTFNSLGDYNGFTAGTFTVGSGITIQAATGGGYLGGNSGSGGGANNVINQGHIQLSGTGMLTLGGAWTNQGTINQSGGVLALGGTFNTSDIGNVVRTGGQLQLTGVLTNTGHTLDLTTTTGSLISNGGSIIGGTLSSSGAATFSFGNGSTWSGVTLGSNLTVPTNSLGTLTVNGGLNLSSHTFSVAVMSNLALNGSLTGNGSISFSPPLPNTTNAMSSIYGSSYTVGPGVTIQSSGAGVGINLAGTTWVNQGTLAANNANSPLALTGNWTNQGKIALSNNDTVLLGGTFNTAAIGTVARGDGAADTVIINGTLDNTAAMINLDILGPLHLANCTITGGAITSTGTADLTVTNSATLNGGITLSANLTVNAGDGIIVNGGLTLNHSTITLKSSTGTGSTITLPGPQTIGGTGTLTVDGFSTSSAVSTYNSTSTILGPNILVTTTPNSTGTIGSPGMILQGLAQPGTNGKLTLDSMTLAGTVSIPTGTIVTINNINSTGIITNNGTLNLSGTVILANLGTFTNHGQVNIEGLLDNTGKTFTTDPAQLTWGLGPNGNITGGIIASPLNVFGNATLSNLSIASTITVQPSTALTLSPGLNFSNGTLDILGAPAGSAATRITLGAYGQTSTITGTGTIKLDNGIASGPTSTTLALQTNWTLGPAIQLIDTGGATFSPIFGSGVGGNTLTNNGTITANTSTGLLNLSTYNLINTSTIAATSGSTINITGSLNNSGGISANAATLGLTAPWTNAGIIGASNGSTINVAGASTPALLNQLQFNGSNTLNITGTLTNTGNTLDGVALNASLGLIGGNISGGSISHAITISNGILNGVALNASTVATLTGPLTILGTSSNAGIISGSTSVLTLGQTALPSGLFTNTGTVSIPAGSITEQGVFNSSGPVIAANMLGNGTFNLLASTAQMGPITGAGNINISSGAKLIAASIMQGDLIDSGTLVISVRAAGTTAASNLSVLKSLNLNPGGLIDLNNNDLLIHTTDPLIVQAALQTGYSGGTWNGATGIRSTAAAASSLYTLGSLYNATATGVAILTKFDGITAVARDELIKFTYYGDATLDGKVDGSDFSRLDSAYLSNQNGTTLFTGWYNGDFNYDGVINGADYTLIDNSFNAQGAQLLAGVASSVASSTTPVQVPEPAGLIGIGMIVTSLLRRRSSRQLNPASSG